MRSSLFIIFILSLVGCAPKYFVKIDSLATEARGELNQTYVLVSGDKNVSEKDLLFKEFSAYLKYVLKEKGLKEASDAEHADLAVVLKFGLSDPKYFTEVSSTPVYQYNPSQTYSVSATSYGSTGSTYTSGTIHTSPSFSMAGTDVSSHVKEIYSRTIFISAYDLKHWRENHNEKQLWTTSIVSSGSSGDLRTVFPALMFVAKDLVGSNTGHQVSRSISTEDERIDRFVRKVLTDPDANPDSARFPASAGKQKTRWSLFEGNVSDDEKDSGEP